MASDTTAICEPKICEIGGSGNILPLFGDAEQRWPKWLRVVLYLIGLLWFFMGVAIVADIFMGAIERITSKKVRVRSGETGRQITMKVWNDTVANLTLMALGSSAPEILLSIIELVGNSFYSGDLGPATIVGSAAFNLLCITAVCVVAIPNGEVRAVKETGVFAVTATFSVFAYVWLCFIVLITSKDEIEVWEGAMTFLFFPILVVLSFWADKGYFSIDIFRGDIIPKCNRAHRMVYLKPYREYDGWGCDGRFRPGGCKSGITDYYQSKGIDRYRCEICDYDLCKKCACVQVHGKHAKITVSDISKEELATVELKIRQQHGEGLTDEQMARLIQREHTAPQSRASYRVRATRNMVGGRRVNTSIDHSAEYTLTSIVPVDTDFEGSQATHCICAKGHTLQRFISPQPGYNCDACGARFPKFTPLWGCRVCNFDACVECKSKFARPCLTIEFACGSYAVLESIGTLTIQVLRTGCIGYKAAVEYRTRDGTAKAEEDYKPIQGTLEFLPGEFFKDVRIEIIDDTTLEDDEDFFVDLLNPHIEESGPKAGDTIPKVMLGHNSTANVCILDDDEPGILAFAEETVTVSESTDNKIIHVTVKRKKGGAGTISCRYKTEDATATVGCDYAAANGILEFKPGQMSIDIPITVMAAGHYENTEEFRLIIFDAMGGARFDQSTDGGADSCICTIIIESDETTKGRIDRVMSVLKMDWDKAQIGRGNWKDQLREAILVNGGEEEDDASLWDWTMHLITVFWKVLFAFIPPADFCDGWLCFGCALMMIGVVTAFIGDLASLLGCVVGIPDSITAITFVALGTSLPDTFASKSAAEQDQHADASIGNVTGSNSVNVFLGLGLPWLMGAIYWTIVGRTPEWETKYKDLPHIISGTSSKFAVIGGDLGFSVMVFTCTAVCCLCTLILRRKLFGGELGGPPLAKWVTCTFFVMLWFLYIGLSSWYILLNSSPC